MFVPWLALASCVLSRAPEPAEIDEFGQWIWSDEDAALFEESRRTLPDLMPTVFIATIHYRNGRFESQLGYDPLSVRPPLAVLVRVDDSAHDSFDVMTPPEIADALGQRLSRLLAMLEGSGVTPVEIQLDYDCPARRLSQWAAALAVLRAGALSGREIWITSLVSHLEDPSYGQRLQGVVRGHILQVFDAGDVPLDAQRVGALAARAALPYRMGLGAFERGSEGVARTEHAAWFDRLGETCLQPWCEGVWVFPAGVPWVHHLAEEK